MGSRMTRLGFVCLVTTMIFVFVVVSPRTTNGESQIVEFPVTGYTGETITLTGKLTRSDSDGPFPALVLLHGCDGVEYDDPATVSTENTFIARGYVVLLVDSFTPRGITGADGVCDGTDWLKGSPRVRAGDAHAGKDYLASLPYVDGERVAVIGWSHGGMTVLEAVKNIAINEPARPRPFKAAIAFYPNCPLKLRGLDAPLLVLIGDADDWTRAVYCKAMTLKGETKHEYELVVYPGATHAFDWENAPGEYLGHKLIYDPEATADAYKRVAEFLERHLSVDTGGKE